MRDEVQRAGKANQTIRMLCLERGRESYHMVQPDNGKEIPGRPSQDGGCTNGDAEINQKGRGDRMIPKAMMHY